MEPSVIPRGDVMKKGVAAISILLILPSMGFAQSPTRDPGSTEGVGRIALMVEIDRLQRPATLEFRHSGQALDHNPNQAQPKTLSRHPVLIGAAIGAGGGLLINVTACRTGESVCSAPGNLLMAGIGAGIGALFGVLVSRH
jgi:hypothetical protein